MYLETIYVLSKQLHTVRSIDVGEYMGFSKPSVSRAVGLLKQGGYVLMGHDGALTLTEEGRRIAQHTYECHQLLTQMFIALGVDSKIAAADACRIEQDISNETFEALKKHFAQTQWTKPVEEPVN